MRKIEQLPDLVLYNIFDELDLRSLVWLSGTSHRLRDFSLDAVKRRTVWKVTEDGKVAPTSEEVLKCPKSYAIWIARMPKLGIKIEDILWSSDAALTVEDIETAADMIEAGQLPTDFINRKADSLKKALSLFDPQLSTVTSAAAMAKMGILDSVRILWLEDLDLSSVPSENLSALCSIVTGQVCIVNVTGDLITVLNSVECRQLRICAMALDVDATRALVTAMANRVEEVKLMPDVRLDTGIFTQYGGEGKCWRVEIQGNTNSYVDTFHEWSKGVKWIYAKHHDGSFSFFSRNYYC